MCKLTDQILSRYKYLLEPLPVPLRLHSRPNILKTKGLFGVVASFWFLVFKCKFENKTCSAKMVLNLVFSYRFIIDFETTKYGFLILVFSFKLSITCIINTTTPHPHTPSPPPP